MHKIRSDAITVATLIRLGACGAYLDLDANVAQQPGIDACTLNLVVPLANDKTVWCFPSWQRVPALQQLVAGVLQPRHSLWSLHHHVSDSGPHLVGQPATGAVVLVLHELRRTTLPHVFLEDELCTGESG
ncbi:hypothetical protein D3C76_1555020 [compost metagenome]